jgi:cellulose synthase/poly-beta-1,6-N-acetylglucosamine synthase-like glycosyltransferase
MTLGLLFWAGLAWIVYFYLGYPAAVALLARLFPRRRAPGDAATPPLTLLIAAYNEERVIAHKLENSLALDYPADRLQILVAADGSDDGTAAAVRAFAPRGVELAFSPVRAGKMAALNRAVPQARGEILVFSDANNSYEPDALRRLVRHFADPRVGAVGGAKVIVKDDKAHGAAESAYWRYESFLKRMETRLGCCVAVVGEMLAVRRALWAPQPADTINDDFFIAMAAVRQGFDVVYDPLARSLEPISQTEREEIVRRARMNMGHLQCIVRAGSYLSWRRPLVAWQVFSHKLLRPLMPIPILAVVAAALAAALLPPPPGPHGWLRLAPPWNLAAAGLVLAGFAAALLGRWTRSRGALGRLLYIATFLLNSNFAALVGLLTYLRGGRTVLWRKAERRG